MKNITIKGARVHNLKGININIPKNSLVVATGVSGSGKSSLVFDIIFEEGRKQYLQSLGILAGIENEDKFDSITGIGPTIAVQQNIIRQSNPRSTVGTKTNLIGLLAILYAGEGRIQCNTCGTFVNSDLICPKCGNIEERLPASYFIYNNPNGICNKCSGRGAYFEINMNKLVPTEETSLEEIIERIGMTPGYANLFRKRFIDYLYMPFNQIPDEIKVDIIQGHHVNSNYNKKSYCLMRIFQGGLYRNSEDLKHIYSRSICSDCHGFRTGEEARRVFLNDMHIGQLGMMTISELNDFLANLMDQKMPSQFGRNLLKEILEKVKNLILSRLGYLTLYREMPSLSGGEIQRLFLNSHLNSKMESLIYIFDEPTMGLHESEKLALLKAIKSLKELGNTVIVVEHDKNTIESAEHIIDMGPKAGINGGQVVYQGNLAGLLQCNESLTGQYLSGKISMPTRSTNQARIIQKNHPHLTIFHAKTNNLKDVSIDFPLGVLLGIAGVSGSGKSSLISESLIPLLKTHFNQQSNRNKVKNEESDIEDEEDPIDFQLLVESIEGIENINGFVEMSQAPIGRNNNSNPATYIGIWDKIRKLFANQPEAKQQEMTPGHFSFNSKGACSVCGGSGREKIWLGGDFSIDNICKECHGKRFNEEALDIKYKGKNIAEVLEMSVSDAIPFFGDISGILSTLKVMDRIGMGYITLGQPTPTLSGGEGQRIKLAKEIGRRRKGNILYVMDEPTTGLSLYDTAKLIQLLDELITKGNSIIVIEHDINVLTTCDWIIELGPGSGMEGGNIIAEGSPQSLKNNPNSITGRYFS